MNKDYKIEMTPSFWVVTLESGCYSAWDIDYLFFRGNDEDEIWNFLCRYWEDTYEDYDGYPALFWKDRNKKYVIKKWIEDKDRWDYEYKNKLEDVNFDSNYGDAKLVKIKRMNIITFKK